MMITLFIWRTFQKVDIHNIDSELEKKIKKSQMICSIALSIRKREKIKVRQPLNKVLIPFRNSGEKREILEIEDFIKSEINVKKVELISDSSEILVKKAKPNFKSLGPKFGKKYTNRFKENFQFRRTANSFIRNWRDPRL